MELIIPEFTTSATITGQTLIRDVDEQLNIFMDDAKTYLENTYQGVGDSIEADLATNLQAVQDASASAFNSAQDAEEFKNTTLAYRDTTKSYRDQAEQYSISASYDSALVTTNAQEVQDNATLVSTKAQEVQDNATLVSTKAQEVQDNADEALSALEAIRVIYDDYDDRYLGHKTSDPLLDNDGDPLVVGATYWNTTTKTLKFFNGAMWEDPEATASQAAQQALVARDEAIDANTNAQDALSIVTTKAQEVQDNTTLVTTNAQEVQDNATLVSTKAQEVQDNATLVSTKAQEVQDNADEAQTILTTIEGIFADGLSADEITYSETLSVKQAIEALQASSTHLVDYVGLDTATSVAPLQGQLTWDSEHSTAILGLTDDLQLPLGQMETIEVIANAPITKAKVIMAVGSEGNSGNIVVSVYTPSTDNTKRIIAISATSASSTGDKIIGIRAGLFKHIDTTGSTYSETWVNGDILYASNNGGLTKVKPSTNVVPIAFIIHAHTSGSMYIRVPSGAEVSDVYTKTQVDTSLGNKVDKVTGKGLSTEDYTTAEKTKLAGIEAGATGDMTASEILTAIKTVDGSGSGLDADLLDGQHGSYYQPASTAITTSNIATQSVSALNDVQYTTLDATSKASSILTGGGTISYIGGYVGWTQRFIAINNGNGSHFSTNGYFDITCPTSGTITGVGGAASVTATTDGIPLSSWQALYYILPISSSSTTVAENFRVVGYHSALVIPNNWVKIATVNGDGGYVEFCNGVSLKGGTLIDTSAYDVYDSVQAYKLYSTAGYSLIPAYSSAFRMQTPYGYLDIGAMNSSYCHLYTDRASFYTNKRITIGSEGAVLPNVQVSASNVLDWYEEGTFTPTIYGFSTTGVGTYTTQIGYYTRIGDICYIQLSVAISAHTGSGSIRIGGLPFVSKNDSGLFQSLSIGNVSNLTFTGSELGCYIYPNSSFIALIQSSSNTGIAGVPVDTSFSMLIGGFYKCN